MMNSSSNPSIYDLNPDNGFDSYAPGIDTSFGFRFALGTPGIDPPERQVTVVADRYRRRVITLIRVAAQETQDLIDEGVLETILSMSPETTQGYLDQALNTSALQLQLNMETLYLTIMEKAGNKMRGAYPEFVKAPDPQTPTLLTLRSPDPAIFAKFDVTNMHSVEWASERSATLVTEMTEESKRAIRQTISNGFTQQIQVRQTASILKQTISLTGKQAQAVTSLRRRILASSGKRIYAGKTAIRVPVGGMDATRMQRVLAKYSDRLLRQRAMNIARTETINAANQGQSELWKQAVEKGQLDPNTKRVWIAALSERTCPICMELNGQERGFEELWVTPTGEVDGPTAHPQCRCTTGLVSGDGKKAEPRLPPVMSPSPADIRDKLSVLPADTAGIKEARKQLLRDKPGTWKGQKSVKVKKAYKHLQDEVDDFERMVDPELLSTIRKPTISIQKGSGTPASGRSSASYWNSKVDLEGAAKPGTTVHELSHLLEKDKDLFKAAVEFLEKRTAGNATQPLSVLTKNSSYRADEVARLGGFRNPYTGKLYVSRKRPLYGSYDQTGDYLLPSQRKHNLSGLAADERVYATEIVSMGMEEMWKNPIRFAKEDPGFFDFIMTHVVKR